MSNTVTYRLSVFLRVCSWWRGSAAQRGEAGKNSGALNANKGSNFGGDSKSREVASEWKRKMGGLYTVKPSLEGSSRRGRIRLNHPRWWKREEEREGMNKSERVKRLDRG